MHKHECLGVALFEPGQLRVHRPSHKLKHERPDRIIKEDGALIQV